MTSVKELPWKNGLYQSNAYNAWLIKIEDGKCAEMPIIALDYPEKFGQDMQGEIKSGKFGETRKEVKEATGGIEEYNVEVNAGMLTFKGVLSQDGTKIYAFGMMNHVEIWSLLTPEALEKLKESREHVENMSCQYKIQPENQGKLVWLSGPPGAGKSTTGQLMGREANYVYYEADCTSMFLNPFIDVSLDNLTVAGMSQAPIKGFSKDFVEVSIKTQALFQEAMQGDNERLISDEVLPLYTHLAEAVGLQKRRIGGNFVIAEAVPTRKMRDHIKKTLPDCIFVTLTLSKEVQDKRCKSRHGDGEGAEEILKMLTGLFELYEGPQADESNTFNVDILEGMSKQDVMKKVLEVLEKET